MAADVRSVGLDPADRTLRMVIDLAGELIGFPRHLSQHTGGMVITNSPLSEVVPIEKAAMPERTVIEWDKEDLDALGILKIDPGAPHADVHSQSVRADRAPFRAHADAGHRAGR